MLLPLSFAAALVKEKERCHESDYLSVYRVRLGVQFTAIVFVIWTRVARQLL